MEKKIPNVRIALLIKKTMEEAKKIEDAKKGISTNYIATENDVIGFYNDISENELDKIENLFQDEPQNNKEIDEIRVMISELSLGNYELETLQNVVERIIRKYEDDICAECGGIYHKKKCYNKDLLGKILENFENDKYQKAWEIVKMKTMDPNICKIYLMQAKKLDSFFDKEYEKKYAKEIEFIKSIRTALLKIQCLFCEGGGHEDEKCPAKDYFEEKFKKITGLSRAWDKVKINMINSQIIKKKREILGKIKEKREEFDKELIKTLKDLTII